VPIKIYKLLLNIESEGATMKSMSSREVEEGTQ